MRRFNLLDEHWILVLDKEGKSQELSLREVFYKAANLRGLANELPTLDVAILRFLLAIMHASLARDVKDYNSGIDLWRELWKSGLPTEKICKYLEQWRDRFWLFDDKYPFYQVASLTKGTEYDVSKLLGTICESNNKVRQFPIRTGKGKTDIKNAEAARWLLYINGFDDTSAKPKTKGAPSSGAGWLGKLGLIYTEGESLAETLLLNFQLLDSQGEPWQSGKAQWELEKVRTCERTEIVHPKSQVELLTMQSRRLCLKCENDAITGYILLGGDFFSKENAFCEQMTQWKKPNEKKEEYVPRRHDPSKQLWRDFAVLTSQNTEEPGILKWLSLLKSEDLLMPRVLKLCTASVKYGDKDFFIDDVFSDSLSFNASLLSKLEIKWNIGISNVLAETEEAVRSAGKLAVDVAEASGDRRDYKGKLSSNMKGRRDTTKSEAYFRLDLQFRTWLECIVPEKDDLDTKCDEWRGIVMKTLLKLGGELVKAAGVKAFIGYNNKNISSAYNKFLASINKILQKTEVKNDG
jgi:CRISPR system Cascade subunit CasA